MDGRECWEKKKEKLCDPKGRCTKKKDDGNKVFNAEDCWEDGLQEKVGDACSDVAYQMNGVCKANAKGEVNAFP